MTTDESHSQGGYEAGSDRMVPLSRGLSTKLLVLTIIFVLIAEVLIFVPSVANFRLQWLTEKLGTAAAVSTLLVEGNADRLRPAVRKEVLMSIGAKAIAVRDEGVARLLVISDVPPRVDEHIPLDEISPFEAMTGALDTLFFGGDRMLRAFGRMGESTKEFEIIIPDYTLRKAMLVYARNIAFLSLLISLFTATLVFYAINRIMIRPVRDMTRSMLAFSEAPDDPARIIRPEDRGDEIGVAERELAAMQTHLQKTLSEQKHLADLGLAVSKINHDMRNMLASAQLMSERLRTVKDPTVQLLSPRLVRTLGRAVAYTEGVLAYGRTQEAPPQRRRIRLYHLVDDVQNALGIDSTSGIEFINAVDEAHEIDGDSEQLFRAIANLCRNSVEAMTAAKDSLQIRRLTISAERNGTVVRILVTDTGPGLPQKARENLFAAFRGSARSGGTGLGLAIAHELVRAHGGTLELVESIGGNTVFAIVIPDEPIDIEQARGTFRRPA